MTTRKRRKKRRRRKKQYSIAIFLLVLLGDDEVEDGDKVIMTREQTLAGTTSRAMSAATPDNTAPCLSS